MYIDFIKANKMKKYFKNKRIKFINYMCLFPLLCLLFFTDQDKEIEQLLTLINK